MYEIFPKSLKEFIEDTSIKLPRFQRKASWDDKKRFELALSIFKNYPLGASILSKETDEYKNITEWLLDGRQRRDSLKMIYEDPEQLYVWAKKYLPIKTTEPVDKLETKFWNKVSDFIQEEKEASPSKVETESGMDTETINNDVAFEEDKEENTDITYNEKEVVNDQEELATLLGILKLAFLYKTKYQTGLTSSFDFKNYLMGKSFFSALYDSDQRVSSAKLRRFLREYKNSTKDYKNYAAFVDYLDRQYDWKDENSKSKLESKLKEEWNSRQLQIIQYYDRIDFLFMNRRIAIIETHDITSTDSQKIFNLINTGGTQLTASEILSAKPKWNVPVKNPSSKYENAIKKLYACLDLGNCNPNTKVKWDIPAASTYYFEEESSGFSLFFKFDSKESNEVAKRITVGFKLLSALLGNGVKKEDIDSLANKVDWGSYEDTLCEIKEFFDSFQNNVYLKVLQSWGKSLSDIVSDAPTMNYLALLYRSWKKLGKPNGFLTESKKIFDKNSFIELDRIVFGYLSNQWKGSSDSTLQRNIENFEMGVRYDSVGLFNSIPASEWKNTLSGIFDNNTLNNKPIVKGLLAPLVYYYNCLKELKGVGSSKPGQIDHIIPQSAWKSSTISNKDSILNNVFNLTLLPEDVNKSKNDQSLVSVSTNVAISRSISEYEEIELTDFAKFSNVSNYKDLKTLRENLYYKAFGETRDKILNDA